jgi:hypothetical protein
MCVRCAAVPRFRKGPTIGWANCILQHTIRREKPVQSPYAERLDCKKRMPNTAASPPTAVAVIHPRSDGALPWDGWLPWPRYPSNLASSAVTQLLPGSISLPDNASGKSVCCRLRAAALNYEAVHLTRWPALESIARSLGGVVAAASQERNPAPPPDQASPLPSQAAAVQPWAVPAGALPAAMAAVAPGPGPPAGSANPNATLTGLLLPGSCAALE